MADLIDVRLSLQVDDPSSLTFDDVYAGLEHPWYRARGDASGSVELWANPEGFEWLGRLFLKLARSPKVRGFHDHLALEFSTLPSTGEPELTVGLANPGDFSTPETERS